MIPIQKRQDDLRYNCVIYFSMHYHDSMIGRAYLQLQTYLKMRPHMLLSQVIYHLIDILGQKLLRVYKSHFRKTLNELVTVFLPRYEDYIASGDIRQEPQTDPKLYDLTGEDSSQCKGPKCLTCGRCKALKTLSGIDQAKQYCDLLRSHIKTLTQ